MIYSGSVALVTTFKNIYILKDQRQLVDSIKPMVKVKFKN